MLTNSVASPKEPKGQTTKLMSAVFLNNVLSKLYHFERVDIVDPVEMAYF